MICVLYILLYIIRNMNSTIHGMIHSSDCMSQMKSWMWVSENLSVGRGEKILNPHDCRNSSIQVLRFIVCILSSHCSW